MQRHVIQGLAVLILGGILGIILCIAFPRTANAPKGAVISHEVRITPTKTLATPTLAPTTPPTPTIATHSASLLVKPAVKEAGGSAVPTNATQR